jgi:hypothetical protein
MKAFFIMGRVIKGAYEELFLIVTISVVWWLGAILIVTAPLVTVGLHNVANRMANYKRVEMSFFWEGARTRKGQGALLFLLCLLAPPLMWFSIQFYFDRGTEHRSPFSATTYTVSSTRMGWLVEVEMSLLQSSNPARSTTTGADAALVGITSGILNATMRPSS